MSNTLQMLTFERGTISMVRMSSARSDHAETGPLRRVDAFGIISQLKPFINHRLWRDGKLVYQGGHPMNALAITDLADEWRCHHRSPFDNARFIISKKGLAEFAYMNGHGRFQGLNCQAGHQDPLVRELAEAVLRSLKDTAGKDVLLVDHMLVALQAHLLVRYGGMDAPRVHKGGLTNRQLDLAKEFLAATLDTPVGTAEVAKQCGLSVSYFIRAFKVSTGRTPYRWLLESKIAKAEHMLLGDASIAEIAVECGFSDQSHLTRAFTSIRGVTPGFWRREHKTFAGSAINYRGC